MIANVRSGQLSNRLVSTAYVLALAIEYRRNIRLTEFDDLAENYMCAVTWPQKVVVRGSSLWALERTLCLSIKKRFPRFHVPRVISGWDYRNEKGAERHADKLRKFFTPRESVLEEARPFADSLRSEGRVVIGVHVRRGDYAQWKGGRYCFGDDVYAKNMAAVEQELMAKGKNVLFVLFSHEPVNLENYNLRSPICKSDFNAVQDHWLMSQCDYIMGPPSTFSLWAAYMGKRLLAFVEGPDRPITLSAFEYHGLKVRC